MKLRTIGCVELNSISTGMHVADEMVKAAEVQLVLARPTCPGRYLVIVTGDTGAVKSSVSHGRAIGADMVVDWFVIPSVHESVIPAMNGTAVCPRINALGCIETCTTAACILAADAAAKSGQVHLIELRFAAGLGGKAFVTMTGEVQLGTGLRRCRRRHSGRRRRGARPQPYRHPLAQRRIQSPAFGIMILKGRENSKHFSLPLSFFQKIRNRFTLSTAFRIPESGVSSGNIFRQLMFPAL